MAYCTTAQVSSYIGEEITESTSPNTTQVTEFINANTEQIETLSDTSYEEKTVTEEYYDFDRFNTFNRETSIRKIGRYDTDNLFKIPGIKLSNYPITEITSIEVNKGTINSINYVTLTENVDYIYYPETGIVLFITSNGYPNESVKGVKVSYKHGRTGTIPSIINKLCALMTAKDVLRTKQMNSSYNSIDSISIETISITKSSGDSVQLMDNIDKEITELQEKIVGTTSYEII